MKKYILFVNTISGIGGAQLYILRKAKFLETQGYNVYIVASKTNPIEIEEISNYKFLEVQELQFPVNIFGKNKKKKIIDKINDFIENSPCDEMFIESHEAAIALWGELFASYTQNTNLVYALTPFSLKRKVFKNFFYDKLDKNLFLGYKKSFIESNFLGKKFKNNYINIPFNGNEIEMKKCNDNSKKEFDLNLLTISRIDKTYIIHSINQLKDFASVHQNLKIKYDIYIDRRRGKDYERLVKVIESSQIENFNINLKGPIMPLNNCIFNNQDIFIGMGTAILNASSMKVPSLVIDYRNNNCYGFFGLDYEEFGICNYFAENKLSYYLKLFLKDKNNRKELGEKGYNLFLEEFENAKINSKFIEYIEEQTTKNIPHTKIPSHVLDLRDLVDFCSVRFLGVENAIKIRKLISFVRLRFANHI